MPPSSASEREPDTALNLPQYYHGHGNPGWHSGSQLYVQTKASSFCIETMRVNKTDANSDVYCPTWAGGEGKGATQAAPNGRFPTFGESASNFRISTFHKQIPV